MKMRQVTILVIALALLFVGCSPAQFTATPITFATPTALTTDTPALSSDLEESIQATDEIILREEIRRYQANIPYTGIGYYHWDNYVRSILETQFDLQTIYDSKLTVHTTLDPLLQEIAERVVKEQIKALSEYSASNGALVAIRPSTGEILAMVGSVDYEANDGQINMTVRPRQPGSSIKPLTYTAAFEMGWTPATLIWDVPSEFPPSGNPNDPRPPYEPVNYDERFHGPVTARSALANSYNIPAVKTLDFVGIYDNPETPSEDGFIAFAHRMGITTLDRDDYGLSLTLGGGDVTLLELTSAYATLANNGNRIPPTSIWRIEDREGAVVYQYETPADNQVVRPEHAYLITDILSDNDARTPAFGPNSLHNLPFKAAAKTGTTNDFRDNWTLGYTPDLAVGVWVGNTDYAPMENISGLTGAAPIWNEFMREATLLINGGNPKSFLKPVGIIEREICAVSGTEPSVWCPQQRSEYFATDQLPLPSTEDLWQNVLIDTWTGLYSSPACGDFTDEKMVLNVSDTWAVKWIQETADGQAWAEGMGFSSPIVIIPTRECGVSDPRPLLSFISPTEGETIRESSLQIIGLADASVGFKNFRLEYGQGRDPIHWQILIKHEIPINPSEIIYTWDLGDVPEGELTLRLYMESTNDTYAEKHLHLTLR